MKRNPVKSAKQSGSTEPLPGRCGARIRKSDPPRYCAKWPSPGRVRCRLHGGADGTGAPLKHGRRSKLLVQRLRPMFEQALRDTTLIELHEDLAVVEALIADTLKELNETGHAAMWHEAITQMERMKQAAREGDTSTLEMSLMMLESVLKNGSGNASREERVLELIERRRRLVETEARRLRDAERSLNEREAMGFMMALLSAVENRVKDAQTRKLIAYDFQMLIGRSELSRRAEG